MDKDIITEKEAQYCLLYVNAPAPMTGDARRCYQKVFGENISDAEAQYLACRLMQKECVKTRIADLEECNAFNTDALRNKITSNLIKIMDECSETQYKDRFGCALSPAPMRSVSVAAAKALADIHGIKEAIHHKVSLEGTDGANIVFNINVPKDENTEEQFDD